ncbi:MAG: 2-C-methyl-D-erythritol 4-phosphate cytidylyltransferase [Syntrophales bacterium]|jgi:2-C-methyl-D-erythritol 4-phosphate cytidylyltransferase/2-C-methyl-D-erythritol 2,4-cyclodiphosphate synthase|nr:2-C-methyl-D-erythritol 4-phosphate cytidylyltransferase [Syntrophales bacterium]MDX9922206.1 2-C-methyl-D-erythritol 4-phosphate cytidylyltransferase [Syntrophales bacterium]
MKKTTDENSLPPAVAIVVAGGSGRRMGGDIPKQYRLLGGLPVITRTLGVFEESSSISGIIVVVPVEGGSGHVMEAVASRGFSKIRAVVSGGSTRQESVRNALAALNHSVGIVAVHDGVRPLVPVDLIDLCVREARKYGAVVPGIPVADTLKSVDGTGRIRVTVEREGLWLVQTPQVFHRHILQDAYDRAFADGFSGTDDAVLVERTGVSVVMIPGSRDNMKITLENDLARAEEILTLQRDVKQGRRAANPVHQRVGFGYDSHRLVEGRKLFLGGCEIPYDRGLLGHSDADVLLHAIGDALLGAVGAGDLGRLFPDDDPAWKDISSTVLLETIRSVASGRGYGVHNVDATVILERPRLKLHIDSMEEAIARLLGVEKERVSVKASTNEGMGFIGRGEGIAAFAVVSVAGNEHDDGVM